MYSLVSDLNSVTDLCGTEVLAGYPHDEVDCEGLNHFPDGVFQKCRKILQKESEAERVQLRRQARSRQRAHGRSHTDRSVRPTRSSSRVVPVTSEEESDESGEGVLPIARRRNNESRRQGPEIVNHFDRFFDGAIRQQQYPPIYIAAASPYVADERESDEDGSTAV